MADFRLKKKKKKKKKEKKKKVSDGREVVIKKCFLQPAYCVQAHCVPVPGLRQGFGVRARHRAENLEQVPSFARVVVT